MAARVSNRSLCLPDIRYKPFRNLLNHNHASAGRLPTPVFLREFHLVQE